MDQDLLKAAYDPDTFRREGYALIDLLSEYLRSALGGDREPVLRWETPDEQLRRWEDDSLEAPSGDVQQLFKGVLDGSVHLHHPQYMGHQISPPAPVAALAGLLGDLLNNGMGVYEMGAPATAIERVVTRQVARRLGLGEAADGILTSGGSLANLTALLAARSSKAGNVWREGTSEPLALMVSAEAHYCVDRAARIMGWGEEGIIKVPVDDEFRLRADLLPACLEKARAGGRRVIAVVGSACTTSTGAYDDLAAIADFCQAQDLWFHVDGAHGAPAAFSPKYAALTRGIERADSVTMDFHKMLLTPSVTTALLFRDGRDSYHTFAQQGQYLWSRDEEEEWYNLAKRTFECTKLMLSVKAYSLLRTYGWDLFDQYVTTVIDRTRELAGLIRDRSDMDLAVAPDCNIICFRYRPAGVPEEDLDALNDRIRQTLLEQGAFYIVKTKLRGRSYLRCTLTNAFTTTGHLEGLLEAVSRTGAGELIRR